jgi:hypothetical protein
MITQLVITAPSTRLNYPAVKLCDRDYAFKILAHSIPVTALLQAWIYAMLMAATVLVVRERQKVTTWHLLRTQWWA